MNFLVILIIFAVCIFLFVKISNFFERKRENKFAEEFLPEVDALLADLEGKEIDILRSDLRSIKDTFDNQLAILEDAKGNILNICPKCGDTLTIRNTKYYGEIMGCPNYPKCRYILKVRDFNLCILDFLRIRGS